MLSFKISAKSFTYFSYERSSFIWSAVSHNSTCTNRLLAAGPPPYAMYFILAIWIVSSQSTAY
nr:hypothetical protein [Bacillus mycoides]